MIKTKDTVRKDVLSTIWCIEGARVECVGDDYARVELLTHSDLEIRISNEGIEELLAKGYSVVALSVAKQRVFIDLYWRGP